MPWGPRIARGRVTTKAFFLFADCVFGLGYRRWQWGCNANNAPSRRAADRFGFTFEGIFRTHLVVNGESRGSAAYSIADAAWRWRKAGSNAGCGRRISTKRARSATSWPSDRRRLTAASPSRRRPRRCSGR
jgi:hypothetical protein